MTQSNELFVRSLAADAVESRIQAYYADRIAALEAELAAWQRSTAVSSTVARLAAENERLRAENERLKRKSPITNAAIERMNRRFDEV